MAETVYGIRKYTCSEKTKRPQKNPLDVKKIEKRNSRQKSLYITLENIDEMFSNNERWPICYDLLFNLIQGKVTKYFNTRSYDRKKELSYDCMNVLYSSLKRKLLRLKDNQGLLNPEPTLHFYLSQFFRFVELVVYSVYYHGTKDIKYIIQEPENFKTDDVLNNFNYDSLDNFMLNDKFDTCLENNEFNESENFINIDENLNNNSDKIKKCIEQQSNINNKEKSLLLKLYKNAYSIFGSNNLTKRDLEILDSIKERLNNDPNLLKDLEDILNA